MTFIEELPRRLIPRVLTVHGKYAGPNLYRCFWPNGYLSLKGFIADFCPHERFDDQLPAIAAGRYNLVVTPRISFANERLYQQWRDVLRRFDIAWVYEADDDLWSPEFTDRQVEVFKDMGDVKLTKAEYEIERLQRIYVLQRVDGVTVTTPHLANIAMKYTPSTVYTVPNLVNVDAFDYGARQQRDIPPLTIGWSGTRRQEDDLQQLAEAWRIIADKHPDVKFIVQGYHSPVLTSAVPRDRVFIMRGVDTSEYPAALHNIDIACCAVSDDPWNLGKSAIKFFECSLAGAACVVSKALYGDYVEHGKTGFVASTVEGWVKHLSALIEDAQLRHTIRQNARRAVIDNWSLHRHWSLWIDAWSKILDEKGRIGHNNGTSTESSQDHSHQPVRT